MAFLVVTLATAAVPLSLLAADLFTKAIAHSLLPTPQETTNNLNWHDVMSLFQARDFASFVFVLAFLLPFAWMYSTSKFVVAKNGFNFRLLSKDVHKILWTVLLAIFPIFFGLAWSGFHQNPLDFNAMAEPYMLLDSGFSFFISFGMGLASFLLYDKKPFYSQSLFCSSIMIIAIWAWSYLSTMQF